MQSNLFQFEAGKKPKPPLKELPTYYFPSKLTNPKRWDVTYGTICIRSSREWAYDEHGTVEAFNVSPDLEKRPCALGSYSGGCGHIVNAKHLALELREQILKMLEGGAEPKNIRIFWSPRARELYKERVGKQIVPELTDEEIRKVFLEDVKNSYNIWVGYEHFDPTKKWSTQIIYRHGGHWCDCQPLEVYLWHLEKTMKHKDLVAFLNKSRKQGLRSHLNYELGIQQKHLEDLDKPDWSNHFTLLEELTKDIEYAKRGEVSQKDWGSCLWQGCPNHELDTEEEIVHYSKALGLDRITPIVILQLTLLYQDLISQVDAAKLPEKSSFQYRKQNNRGCRRIDEQQERSPQDIAKWKKILKEKYTLG